MAILILRLYVFKIFEAEQSNLFIENLKGGESLISSLFTCSKALSSPVLELNKTIDLTFEVLRSVLSSSTSRITSSTIGGLTYDKDMFHFLRLSLQMIHHSLRTQGILSVDEKIKLQGLFHEVMSSIEKQSNKETTVHPLIVEELRCIQSCL